MLLSVLKIEGNVLVFSFMSFIVFSSKIFLIGKSSLNKCFFPKVSLRGLLQGKDGRSLESEVALEVLGDLTHQTLEGELADEEFGGLLVSAYLTDGHGSCYV